MTFYGVIEIETLEPVKIGAGGNKKNQKEPSKDYIPGSPIRGASIAELIKMNSFEDYKKDILTKIFFYNAYPYVDENIFIPCPNHLRMDKHKWRQRQDQDSIDVCNLILDEEKKYNQLPYNYLAQKSNILIGLNPEKEYRFHHTKLDNLKNKEDKDNRDKDNIFRYEAITSNQLFRSIIRYDETVENIINKLFEKGSFYTYIGGSKGSGYGKCKIKSVKRKVTNYNEALQELGKNNKKNINSNQLVITCLSDCLFRDEYGQPTNEFPIKEIVRKLREEKNDKFLATSISEGYNSKWKARYPKETTVKAGSVFCYQIDDELSEAEIIQIESKLYGQRNVDGFGWISINDSYPTKLHVIGNNNHFSTKHIEEEIKDKETLKIIIDGLEKAKLRWLRSTCMKEETNKCHILKSQIRNLMDYDIKEKEREYMTDNEKFSIINKNFILVYKYINGVKNDKELDKYAEKKLNTDKGKLFYKYIKNENKLRQYIKDYLYTYLEIKAKEDKGDR